MPTDAALFGAALCAVLLGGCGGGQGAPPAAGSNGAEHQSASSASSAPSAASNTPAAGLGQEARGLLDSCGAMRSDADGDDDAAASARRRCFAVASEVSDDALAELAKRCAASDARACALAGNLYRGTKLLLWQPQLWSVPCGLKGRACARFVDVKVPFELGEPKQHDGAAAERALAAACDGGQRDACIELADLVRADDTSRSDNLRRKVCLGGHVHACASSVFRWLRSGGLLEDPEVDAAAR
jgi:hypothetical protein